MNAIYEHAPTASLIFFFGVFLYVAWRAYRPSAKQQLQHDAMIPLQEDGVSGRASAERNTSIQGDLHERA